MRPPPVLPLLALFACGPPSDDSAIGPFPADSTAPGTPTTGLVTGSPTGAPTPGTAPAITWDGPAIAVDPGPDTHHATAVLAPDGALWVAWQADDLVRVQRDGVVVHDSAPVAFDHPQLAAAGDRVVGLSTLGTGGLNASVWGLDGASLGPPAWLDATVGGWPDLGLGPAGGVAAWTEGDALRCAYLGEHLATHVPVPCPMPLDPLHQVGTLSADFDGTDGWLAWSEATLGTAVTVGLARLGADGASGAAAATTVVHPGYDARPDVVVTASGGLLAWRGADGPVAPSRAWLAPITDPSDPLDPVPLGTHGADRPNLAVVGPLAAVVWDQPDGIWLQWVTADQGALLGEPVLVGSSDTPIRANLALHATADGWTGAVTWETGSPGAREVRIRRFTAE